MMAVSQASARSMARNTESLPERNIIYRTLRAAQAPRSARQGVAHSPGEAEDVAGAIKAIRGGPSRYRILNQVDKSRLPDQPLSKTRPLSSAAEGVVLDDDAHISEDERLAALARYDVMNTPSEPSFDRITRITKTALDVPMGVQGGEPD
jgi:hypothetical protein